ncbi:hypothetical protein P9112_014290 [Eukaryota sp. TZLM1-RC]
MSEDLDLKQPSCIDYRYSFEFKLSNRPNSSSSMGISGLLPYLSSCKETKHLSEFQGKTIAIDGFGLLHKASYTCSKNLVLGIPTCAYLNYCLKIIYTLQSFQIQPYIVFDGFSLPSKEQTHLSRQQTREINHTKALQYYNGGDHQTAQRYFAGAVSITSAMVARLAVICKRLSIPVLCAPYEADSQIAYLASQGVIDGALAEDSDFLVWGVPLLLTKLKVETAMVECYTTSAIFSSSTSPLYGRTSTFFKIVTILSGCDYLQNPPGIGLRTAVKLLSNHESISNVFDHLHNQSKVTNEYIKGFIRAFITFNHQIVYDSKLGTIPINNWQSGYLKVFELFNSGVSRNVLEELQLSDQKIPEFCGSLMEKEVIDRVADVMVDVRTNESLGMDFNDQELQLLLKGRHPLVVKLKNSNVQSNGFKLPRSRVNQSAIKTNTSGAFWALGSVKNKKFLPPDRSPPQRVKSQGQKSMHAKNQDDDVIFVEETQSKIPICQKKGSQLNFKLNSNSLNTTPKFQQTRLSPSSDPGGFTLIAAKRKPSVSNIAAERLSIKR